MVSGVRIWLLLATSFLSTGEVCPKEAVSFYVSTQRFQAHGVRFEVVACLCSSCEHGLTPNGFFSWQSRQKRYSTDFERELRSSVTRRSSLYKNTKEKQAGAFLVNTCSFCLVTFITVNVVPFSLLGDEVHEELPNGLAAACGLLFHPFLLLLCLLPQVGNLSLGVG